MVIHNFQNVLSNKSFWRIIIIYLCMYVYSGAKKYLVMIVNEILSQTLFKKKGVKR